MILCNCVAGWLPGRPDCIYIFARHTTRILRIESAVHTRTVFFSRSARQTVLLGEADPVGE